MVAVTLQQLQEMEDARQHDLLNDFLELFEEGEPLQLEDVQEWIVFSGLRAKDVIAAAKEALKSGFVTEGQIKQLFITQEGLKRFRVG